jgi:hypothetical protein
MTLITRLIVSAALVTSSSLAVADVLRIPVGSQGIEQASVELPERGMSAATVTARWGEPVARQDPVGEPPISRWDYPAFSVYFERDIALHAVRLHQPRAGNTETLIREAD